MSQHVEQPRVRSNRTALGFAAVVALHLLLLMYFAPPHVMFGHEPLYIFDYPLHFNQVDRAMAAWEHAGRLWGYDPLMLAGHPAGALEDLSSKSVELFVIAVSKLGLAPALAFNLYALLVHLLLPFVAYAAARLFRLDAGRAVLVALLWVLLWFFDSFLHWSWFCGMISWAAASYLVVLLVGTLYRATDEQHLRWWLATGGLAALLALVHPFAAFVLLAPCAALYLRDVRRMRRASHVAVALSLVATLAVCAIWLLPALRMFHYVLDVDSFLRPTLDYLVFDFFDLLRDGFQTGTPVRTMLRVLCLASAAIVLWQWRREGDRRFLPLSLLLVGGLLIAYGGGHLWIARQTQPYRQIGPVTLAAAIPAVLLLSRLLSRSFLRGLERPAKLLLLLAALLIVPRFVRGVLFYFPGLLPRRPVPAAGFLQRSGPSALVGFAEPRPYSMAHAGPPAAAVGVRRWLERHLRGNGRVLIEDFMLAEYVAGSTDLPVLGGLLQRAIPHADAHLFRLQQDGDLPGDALRQYFERYAVRYVVVSKIRRKLEWRKDLLKYRGMVDGIRLYETRIEPSFFLRGGGRIAEQAFNRIVVEGASGPDVVIRFHWMETLRCRPGCSVQRFAVEGDRVGFIRVENPPARFEIYQVY